MHVFLSDRAYTSLLAEVSEHPGIETGGVFLGYIDEKACHIIETIDPGPQSRHEELYFEYDRDYCTWLVNKAARLYKNNPTLVGLWHRHPGSFDRFSQLDMMTNRTFAQLSCHGAVSLLVNIDPKPRLSAFHICGNACERVKITVGDENFAPKMMELKASRQLERLIDSLERNARTSGDLPNRAKVPGISRDDLGIRHLLEELAESLKRISVSEETPCAPASEGKDGDVDRLVATFGDDLADLAHALNGTYTLSYKEGALCILDSQDDVDTPDGSVLARLFLDAGTRPVLEVGDSLYLCTTGFVRRALSTQAA